MYKLQLYANKGNDHQLKKLLIFKQILLVSTLGNVKRTVWRICLLMLGCKRLKASTSGTSKQEGHCNISF